MAELIRLAACASTISKATYDSFPLAGLGKDFEHGRNLSRNLNRGKHRTGWSQLDISVRRVAAVPARRSITPGEGQNPVSDPQLPKTDHWALATGNESKPGHAFSDNPAQVGLSLVLEAARDWLAGEDKIFDRVLHISKVLAAAIALTVGISAVAACAKSEGGKLRVRDGGHRRACVAESWALQKAEPRNRRRPLAFASLSSSSSSLSRVGPGQAGTRAGGRAAAQQAGAVERPLASGHSPQLRGGGEAQGVPPPEGAGTPPTAAPVEVESAADRQAALEASMKPAPLTVPLRVVCLRGSVPPLWVKEFIRSQGRHAKLVLETVADLDSLTTDVQAALHSKTLVPKSPLTADLITVGDRWLQSAVASRQIVPIKGARESDWFKRLDPSWQRLLVRNEAGEISADGQVYAAPYRWGCTLIVFRTDILQKRGIPFPKDWSDLWRPELAGRVAFVNSPREVVGAILKSLGGSYNSNGFDDDVPGGRDAVAGAHAALQKQVRMYDSSQYLRALAAGNVWVSVGWSNDVMPTVRDSSVISAVVPKSGTSLWADLWAIPATPTAPAAHIGGRFRGPSPLVSQWLEFCLEPARARSFLSSLSYGACPLQWPGGLATPDGPGLSLPDADEAGQANKGSSLEKTNLEMGLPPAEIIPKCEFMEPLSDAGRQEYKWLLLKTVEEEAPPGWRERLVMALFRRWQAAQKQSGGDENSPRS